MSSMNMIVVFGLLAVACLSHEQERGPWLRMVTSIGGFRALLVGDSQTRYMFAHLCNNLTNLYSSPHDGDWTSTADIDPASRLAFSWVFNTCIIQRSEFPLMAVAYASMEYVSAGQGLLNIIRNISPTHVVLMRGAWDLIRKISFNSTDIQNDIIGAIREIRSRFSDVPITLVPPHPIGFKDNAPLTSCNLEQQVCLREMYECIAISESVGIFPVSLLFSHVPADGVHYNSPGAAALISHSLVQIFAGGRSEVLLKKRFAAPRCSHTVCETKSPRCVRLSREYQLGFFRHVLWPNLAHAVNCARRAVSLTRRRLCCIGLLHSTTKYLGSARFDQCKQRLEAVSNVSHTRFLLRHITNCKRIVDVACHDASFVHATRHKQNMYRLPCKAPLTFVRSCGSYSINETLLPDCLNEPFGPWP